MRKGQPRRTMVLHPSSRKASDGWLAQLLQKRYPLFHVRWFGLHASANEDRYRMRIDKA